MENNCNFWYKKELDLAIQKTCELGYYKSIDIDVNAKHPKLFSQDMHNLLTTLFTNNFAKHNGNFDLSKIKGHCLPTHLKLQSEILKSLGINTVLTVGYVNKSGQDMFKFDSIEIMPKRQTVEGKPSLNYHIWLTLPSYEILDFTFIAHFEYVNASEQIRSLLKDAPSYIFNFGNAIEIKQNEDMVYHPLYVGKEIIRESGIFKP